MDPIASVPLPRYIEAMQLIRPDANPAALERFLAHLTDSGRLESCLIGASVDPRDRYRAAILAMPSPGRTVTFFYSTGGMKAPIACALTNWAIESIPCGGADLAQTLLPVHAHATLAGVLDASFVHLADLHHMQCTMRAPSSEPRLPDDLSLHTAADDELTELLPHTYEGTLDCPALRGLRQPADIVQGHRAGGRIEEDLWLVVNRGERHVGCMLITINTDGGADLAYIGLIPDERGRKLSSTLLSIAIKRLVRRRIRQLRLAVDSANTPALTIYRQLGFRRISTQRAAIRSLRNVQVDSSTNEMSTPN